MDILLLALDLPQVVHKAGLRLLLHLQVVHMAGLRLLQRLRALQTESEADLRRLLRLLALQSAHCCLEGILHRFSEGILQVGLPQPAA